LQQTIQSNALEQKSVPLERRKENLRLETHYVVLKMQQAARLTFTFNETAPDSTFHRFFFYLKAVPIFYAAY